jgi:hypothetical protein
VVVELYKKAGPGRNSPAVYLVKRNGVVIGLLEKYPDSKYEKHPWKALLPYSGEMVGCFYPEEGGKASALAVLM